MRRQLEVTLFLLAASGLIFGWQQFWFLCDDAYIAFRYISNSHLGLGYVWNPPPFRPVDGYTSFLWVVLLDLVWRILGVAPPDSANRLSLLFALGQLAIVTWMGSRICARLPSERGRPLVLGLLLLGTVSNRTVLAWTSSGLETSLFNFLVTAWFCLACWRGEVSRHWGLLLAGAALAVGLTRPDGLIFFGVTLAMLWLSRSDPEVRQAGSLRAAVLLLVGGLAGFYGWRRAVYGSFLPNTYYAKISGWWPEMGLKYLASFALEYALWFWLGLLLISGACVLARRLHRGSLEPGQVSAGASGDERWVGLRWSRPAREHESAEEAAGLLLVRARPLEAWVGSASTVLAVGTLLLHLTYYTLIAGGDHFEYRPYSYAVPLIWLSAAWALRGLRVGATGAVLLLVGFLGASSVLPWTHRGLTRNLLDRASTLTLRQPIAPHLPPILRGVGRTFDQLQSDLIGHFVGMRHQEHKVFLEHLQRTVPPREVGERIPGEGFPILSGGSIGYVGWVLPHVVIIDTLGLNDRFIAHNREGHPTYRVMAHDRVPPPGYLEAWRENVRLTREGWEVLPRSRPLTGGEIRQIERRYEVWLRHLE